MLLILSLEPYVDWFMHIYYYIRELGFVVNLLVYFYRTMLSFTMVKKFKKERNNLKENVCLMLGSKMLGSVLYVTTARSR